MKPYKIEFYIYADSEEEIREAERAAHAFVSSNYQQGIIVSARKITDAPGLPGYHQCARFQWKAESYLDGCPAPPALFE